MIERPYIIDGDIFSDDRGLLFHVNNFDFKDVKRFYIIHNKDTSVIRAWHGHQHEKKFFYVAKGSFIIAIVKIDDWHKPSINLEPEFFELSEKKSQLLCVPAGYANGIKSTSFDAKLVVFSQKTMREAENDSWRYDKNLWLDWSQF